MTFQNLILRLKYFNILKIKSKIIFCLVGYFVSAYFLTKNERKRIKFDWQIFFWGQIKNCIISLAKKWVCKQKMMNNSSTSWQKKKEYIKNKKVPQTFPSEHLILFNLYSKQEERKWGKKLIITYTQKNCEKLWFAIFFKI